MRVEVRDVRRPEQLEGDHVSIERSVGGQFVAGFVSGKTGGTSWTPPPFATAEEALRQSVTWAEANPVRVVYVRGWENGDA